MKIFAFALLFIALMPAYAQLKSIEPSAQTGTSAAVVVDNVPLTHTSQVFPFNKAGDIIGKNDIPAQIRQVFKNAEVILEDSNSDFDHIVKLNIHVSSEKYIPQIKRQLALKFPGKTKPAVTYLIYKLWNGADIAMDIVAVSKTTKKNVRYFSKNTAYRSFTTKAAVLPAGGVTYISGQAIKGPLQPGTHGTLQQLDASLKYLGIDKRDVVQIRAFMNTTADINVVEKELAAYFGEAPIPPVVYVEWLSKEYEIEIELIAASPKATTQRDTTVTFLDLPGMAHSPVYSKATQLNFGKRVYFSALYGTTLNDANAQTEEIFLVLKNLMHAAGCDFTHLAKATYFHTTDAGSLALNTIRPQYYYPKQAPAASKAMFKALPDGKMVGMDMIGAAK